MPVIRIHYDDQTRVKREFELAEKKYREASKAYRDGLIDALEFMRERDLFRAAVAKIDAAEAR